MNSSIGIPAAQQDQLRSLFARHPGIAEVIVFGSRAKGKFREGSDIDMALKGKALDSLMLVKLNEEYDALYLPWKLDLVIYDKIKNPDLKDHIQRVGVSFYKK